MDEAERRRALLRQEAMVAIVMNAIFSIGFFFLIFGWAPAAARSLAFDFLPQSAGVTFLGTFIPSLITYGRMTRGAVAPAGPVPGKFQQLVRVALAAIFAVIVFGGSAAVLTLWLAPTIVAPLPALAMKAIYGGALGWLMTPPLIRSLLGMPMFGAARGTPAQAV